MGNANQDPAPAGGKISGWFLAFLGMTVLCLVLICMSVLRGGWTDAAALAPKSAPSVAAPDIDSVQSVQSVQSPSSLQSVQSAQWAAGLVIADIELLQLADLRACTDLPAEWHNILLLGSDSRDMKVVSMLDTILIASINRNTGELKLTSILRDTVVPIPGRGMQRINTAAYYGGPSLLMQVINAHFGLNITEYALVNFAGMARAIDALDGIYVDIDQGELEQINAHMGEIASYTMNQTDYLAKREAMRLKAPGKDVLINGIQAVSYTRIRNIDSDAARTGRQRLVIRRILERVKGADADQLAACAAQMWGNLITNIDMADAIALARDLLAAGETKSVPEFTIPRANTCENSVDGLINVDFAANARQLHIFLYGNPNP